MSSSTPTEEDTFNRLRRVPYDQVLAEVKRLGAPPGYSYILYNRVHITNQGWRIEEFFELHRKNYYRDHPVETICHFISEYDKNYPRSPG